MADYALVQGNILPVMDVALKEGGAPFLLLVTDTVTLRYRKPGSTTTIVSAMTITSTTGGLIQRTWSIGDTDTEGEYLGQIDVQRVGETAPRTFPLRDVLAWRVNRKI